MDSNSKYFYCPTCFVTSSMGMSMDAELTISFCSYAKNQAGNTRDGVSVYTFINLDTTYTLSVYDGLSSTYKLPPGSFVQAFCSSSGMNELVFQSRRVPDFRVDDTLQVGTDPYTGTFGSGSASKLDVFGEVNVVGNVDITDDTYNMIQSTFSTGSGSVYLNGDTVVSPMSTFTLDEKQVSCTSANTLMDPSYCTSAMGP